MKLKIIIELKDGKENEQKEAIEKIVEDFGGGCYGVQEGKPKIVVIDGEEDMIVFSKLEWKDQTQYEDFETVDADLFIRTHGTCEE